MGRGEQTRTRMKTTVRRISDASSYILSRKRRITETKGGDFGCFISIANSVRDFKHLKNYRYISVIN